MSKNIKGIISYEQWTEMLVGISRTELRYDAREHPAYWVDYWNSGYSPREALDYAVFICKQVIWYRDKYAD